MTPVNDLCISCVPALICRPLELLLVMASAWLVHGDPARLQGLGVALKGAGFRDAGYRVMSVAVVAAHAALFEERRTRPHTGDADSRLDRAPAPAPVAVWGGCRGTVAFYCFEYGNAWWGRWGPSNVAPGGRGLGGSEEAVVYMARELASLG